MPGICGTLSSSQSPSFFDKQVQALNHYNYHIKQEKLSNYNSAAIGLPFSNFETIHFDDRFLLTFFGEIYNGQSIQPQAFYVELIKNIISGKKEYLAQLNGQFQAALYDHKFNSVYLITDIAGTRPLYYYIHQNTFAYSCEVKSLLLDKKLPRDLNNQAIGDLFSFGYVALKNTLFENISNLGPASILRYKDNQISIEKYYHLPYNEDSLNKKKFSKTEMERFVHQSYAKLDQSVKRQIDTKEIFIALSGGLDSRFVAAVAQEYLPEKFTTYTFGNQKNNDILIAREIAKKINSKHIEFMVDPLKVWRFGKQFSHFSDHMSMINGPIQAVDAIDALKGTGQVMLAAQTADVMWGSTLKTRALKRILSVDRITEDNLHLFQGMFHKIQDAEREIIFKADFLQEINFNFSIFNEYIPLSIEKHPFYLYQVLLYFEYARRGIFGGNLMNNFYFDMRMPSYDKDLLDFIAILPMALRKDQYLYQETMSRFFPELARIRNTRTGLPVNSPALIRKLAKLETQVVHRIKKAALSPLISPFKRYRENSYVNYKKWFKYQLNEPLKEVLFDPATLNRTFYKKGGIQRLYDLHINTDADYSMILWQIINLEYFFNDL